MKTTEASRQLTIRDSIFVNAVELPVTCGTEHFCYIGGPGSGKSKSIQLLMQSVLPRIIPRNDAQSIPGSNRRAVIYDAKRDIYSALRGMQIPDERIKILNPFDSRSLAWDMAKDISDDATAVEIATLLVTEQDTNSPFFPNAARAVIGGIFQALNYLAPKKWTFRDVVLALRFQQRMKCILKACPQTRFLVGNYFTGSDAARDVVSTIANTMIRLGFIAAAWHRCADKMSLNDWIQEESILLLGSNPSLESSLQQINSAILHRLTQIVLNQPEAETQSVRPYTWVIIDELRRAGKLGNLPEFMVEGRSKGACVVLAFQDLPGLYHVYGEHLAHELVGTCRNKAFLKISEKLTAEYASQYFGHQDILATRFSTSEGTSVSRSSKSGEVQRSSNTSLSVNKSNYSRPLVQSNKFLDVPSPSPENGIHGYYHTPILGEPYYNILSGDFIDANLCEPKERNRNVVSRPTEEFTLPEWDREDLSNLKLEEHPELLFEAIIAEDGEALKNEPRRPTGQTASNKDSDLYTILPKPDPHED